MKQKLLTLLLCLYVLPGFSQVKFEKGYFITNQEVKTSCFIRNLEWGDNPEKFRYKLSLNSEEFTGSIENITEFSVAGACTYKRFTVNIDRSGRSYDNLSLVKAPKFKSETLFLKLLTDGVAQLYEYREGNIQRYFYSIDGSAVEQLVWKEYKASTGDVGSNNQYKQQLRVAMAGASLKETKFERLSYHKKYLLPLFEQYNQSRNPALVGQKKVKEKWQLNISLRPGLNISSLNTTHSTIASEDIDFDTKPNIRFGVEIEYVLPIRKGKWAICTEPAIQLFEAEKEISSEITAKATYKNLQIPLNLRHYFFLNEGAKLFLSGGAIYNSPFNSGVTYEGGLNKDLDFDGTLCVDFGAGIKIKDKYSAELRYETLNDVLTDYLARKGTFNNLSLIIGITL